MLSVINIPQLKDNYTYAILKDKEVIIIDPADYISISNYLKNNQLELTAILLTHHHSDHTAGVSGLLNIKNVPVYSPNKDIKHTSIIIKDQNIIDLDFISFQVMATPGHTIDHVVFYSKENNILFSGDILFRLGCGRVFEGTYKQMFNSLNKINALDDKTDVYCGHEYTNDNLKFLESVFPKNINLVKEKDKINKQIKKTGHSIPFNLGAEKKINPFLSSNLDDLGSLKKERKLSNFELFSYLRDLKNNF